MAACESEKYLVMPKVPMDQAAVGLPCCSHGDGEKCGRA